MNKENIDLASTLRYVIDTAIDGILTINDKGIIEMVNQSAAQLFQYKPSEMIGKNVKFLMPEPDQSQHDKYIENYNRTKKPKIIGIGREVQGLKKDGTLFPFRLAVSEVVLSDRIIFTGVVHDLTELDEVNRKLLTINNELEKLVELRTIELEQVINRLLSTNKKLEEKEKTLAKALDNERELNELKSRFVSMASHEFRTPLSTILSSASLISKYQTAENQTNRLKHVDRIKSAVNNLTGILNDFLSLSKLEEGKQELKFTVFNLTDVCSTLVNELESILKKGQYFEINIADESVSIYSDRHIIRNILFNLMSNAIKYSPENSPIICNIDYGVDSVSIEVADKGMGIPVQDQQYIFHRFFRASNVENIQGTGLGLHIVEHYINMLKGEISFTSEEYCGCTFTMKIPIYEK
ncbi:PAS domain-containing sensor histidine kinase [Membranihabitans marinus]|uniref:PAS domain-containing sensor histidine kinase n=1 Tax=Membranihabitans marinus TaxID=1227546 RepID=UPI001F4691BC|nr:PAS domain-containing sensor histidine kinase [Membranihabitans marinus]